MIHTQSIFSPLGAHTHKHIVPRSHQVGMRNRPTTGIKREMVERQTENQTDDTGADTFLYLTHTHTHTQIVNHHGAP